MKWIPTGIMTLLVAALTVYAADADSVRKEMLKELIQLNKHLDSLDKKIDKLSKRKPMAANTAMVPRGPRRADKVLLSTIKLPDKPTRDDLKKYIKEIQNACRNQNHFGSDDPQVKMLTKVGNKNLDLLVEAFMSISDGPRMEQGSMYLENAIDKLAGPNDKDLVLKVLPNSQNVVRTVMKYGWEKDAKDILINKVKFSQHVPAEYLKAVAGFRDPSTYPIIRNQFVKSFNPEMIYPYIKDLPIDFDAAINEAWMAAKYSNQPWRLRQMAPLALEHGNVDAFAYMLEYLQGTTVEQHGLPRICFLVRKYSGIEGTTEEISEWVKKNRKNLYFDKKAKKFKVGPKLQGGKR